MIEVKVDMDVREYQEKIVMNLTLRQLICAGIALIVSVYMFWIGVVAPQLFNNSNTKNNTSAYQTGTMQNTNSLNTASPDNPASPDTVNTNTASTDKKKPKDNTSLISWLIIGVVMPIIFVGFFKYNGMTVEKFAMCYIKDKIQPRKRVYKMRCKVHSLIYQKGGAAHGKN